MNQETVFGHVTSRPIWTSVSLELGQGDSSRSELGEVALPVVATEDTAHVDSGERVSMSCLRDMWIR
jgi:hypothetical protein